tara:strand:+ start:290 stop:571 length:282 start_codon:yes stop_codon:yes gene_type:complete
VPKRKIDDGSEFGGWEALSSRLATLRVVGGMPAIRLELSKYSDNVLGKLADIALEASVITDLDETARLAAIEVAAMVLDVQQTRNLDKENDDG